jgi:hypothetical protein
MTQTIFLWVAIVLMFFSCTEKDSEELMNGKGTIKGKVSLYTEFGALESVQEGAVVSVQDGKKELHARSNEKGEYLVRDIPLGTYDIVVEKPGYSTFTGYSCKIAGGREPLYLRWALVRPSTTKITELTLGISGSIATFTGKVAYKSPVPLFRLVTFLSNTPDVSPKKYLSATPTMMSSPSGDKITFDCAFESSLFPSGSTLYAVVYGHTTTHSIAQNPETQLYEYTGLSETPSAIVSAKIP